MATHKPMANAAEESETGQKQNRSRGSRPAGRSAWRKRTVHEEPVPSQNPNQHQHDGEGEGEKLGQGEASTAAEGDPAGRRMGGVSPVTS